MIGSSRPSEYIRRHLAGGKHDLDDLLSIHDRDPSCRDVIEEILAIGRKFEAPEFPIGVANPASFAALKVLAKQLEAEGR